MSLTRRLFLTTGIAASAAAMTRIAESTAEQTSSGTGRNLERALGITMSSVARLETKAGPLRYTMLEWPKILRDELDMTILDLNSGVMRSHEPAYLDAVRQAAADAGCVLTNMKINRADVDIGNSDAAVRAGAVEECKRWIETASRLGLRWARPLPLKAVPNRKGFIEAYRELVDFAAERNVQMVIENYGWMDGDANIVPALLAEIGGNVATCPDTGNWSSAEVRYAGLANMFPRAVSCDFKASKLGPAGEHQAWDLKRCFEIGWGAGFRGPWCFEHAHTDRDQLFRELRLLRDMLRQWMAAKS